MKNFVRRFAVTIGAVAISAGLIGASAVPAHADDDDDTTVVVNQGRDTGWQTG